MPQIRQEINILDSILSVADGATGTSNEIVQLDTTQYNGASYYVEIVYNNSGNAAGVLFSLRRNGTTTDDTVGSISPGASNYTLSRSTSFTPPVGATEYVVYVDNGSGNGTVNIKAARIIIIQNTPAVINTETQIEIGHSWTNDTTSYTAGTAPKYWKYASANWDGTILAYFEATLKCSSTKYSNTAELQVADGTGDGFTGWAAVSGGATVSDVVLSGSVAITRVRSSESFTPIDGRNYRVVIKSSSTKGIATIYNAKIIIGQVGAIDQSQTIDTSTLAPIYGGAGASLQTSQQVGQSFTTGSAYSLAAIQIKLQTTGSPTDNVFITVLSGSINGTVIATSSKINGASISGTATLFVFTFPSPPALSDATKYYFIVQRDGARDTTNASIILCSTSSSYANGGMYSKDNNAWSDESSTFDTVFQTYKTPGITRLEPQYLLANTAFAAGTGLQTFLTKYQDNLTGIGICFSHDWLGVSNVYKYAVDAANGSTSVAELDTSGGTQVSGSSVSSPDNQGISGTMTMPANGNLDTKATTNNGDVYASRILVEVTIPGTQALSDSVAVAENLELSISEVGVSTSVSDISTISDVPTIMLEELVFSVSETSNVTENISLYEDHFDVGVLAESLTITEDVATLLFPYIGSYVDGIVVSESVVLGLLSNIDISDIVTVVEALVYDPDKVYVTEYISLVLSNKSIFLFETISILEDITIILSSIDCSTSELIAVSEDVIFVIPIEYILVSDLTTASENVELSIFNLIFSVFDSATAGEDLTFSIPVLELSTFDSVSIGEEVTLYILVLDIFTFDSATISEDVVLSISVLYVSVFDSITVNGDTTPYVPILEFSVFDSISTSEEVVPSITILEFSVFDSVSIVEYFDLSIPIIYLSIFDSIAAGEGVALYIAFSELSVSDFITIDDNIDSYITFIEFSIFDSIGVGEGTTQYIPVLEMSIFDSTVVSESVTILITSLYSSTFDSVSAGEDSVLYIPILYISINDSVEVGEAIDVSILSIDFSVFDTVNIIDDISIYEDHFDIYSYDIINIVDIPDVMEMEFFIDIFDAVGTAETIEEQLLSPMEIGQVDSISITENVFVEKNGENIIVEETISVLDDISFYNTLVFFAPSSNLINQFVIH